MLEINLNQKEEINARGQREGLIPITQSEAICEGLAQAMEMDPSVIVIGEGVPDPKAIFGSTAGLQERFGKHRVFDSPLSENGVTGFCIGAATSGLRPVMVHQRIDFGLLAMDQIVNNGAKWRYMFGGQVDVPLVIRFIIGRGWGPGPQHSQSLQALFGHIPGLKVVMPVTGHDAKGMMIEAIKDNNPVIFIEHRWLQGVEDIVPIEPYSVALNGARVTRKGNDFTVVAFSYMVIEALLAAEALSQFGVEVEVIDVRSVRPLDTKTILKSIQKTGHMLVADTAQCFAGMSAEVIASVTEQGFAYFKSPPQRIGLPELPVPTSPHLVKGFYPDALKLATSILKQINKKISSKALEQALVRETPHDIPQKDFCGPF